MADIYNVVRGDGVFFEGMTKEQIYELIAEMTGETVQDIDQAFITKLKEINKGNSIRLWIGTSAEYNALETREDDVLYICTDDTFVSDTNIEIQKLWNKIESNYENVGDKLSEQDNDISQFETSINAQMSLLKASSMQNKGIVNASVSGAIATLPAINVGQMAFIDNTSLNGGSSYTWNCEIKLPSSGTYFICMAWGGSYHTGGSDDEQLGYAGSYIGIRDGGESVTWTNTGNSPKTTSFRGMYFRIS